jgi:hypothetical protein
MICKGWETPDPPIGGLEQWGRRVRGRKNSKTFGLQHSEMDPFAGNCNETH